MAAWVISVKSLACASLMALALVGCGSVPRQPFNKEANAHIKSITVVMPPEPAQYMVNIVQHPGMQFGLIGGLIAASELETKSNQFSEAARKNNIALSKGLAQHLAARIKYQVSIAESTPGRKAFMEDYGKVQPAGDAYLDIVFRQAGYSAQHPSTPYIPTFWVPVRLVESKTNKVLYSTLLIYGEPNPVLDHVNVSPDRAYSFNNFDDLMRDNTRAVEGLHRAIEAVAAHVAGEIQ